MTTYQRLSSLRHGASCTTVIQKLIEACIVYCSYPDAVQVDKLDFFRVEYDCEQEIIKISYYYTAGGDFFKSTLTKNNERDKRTYLQAEKILQLCIDIVFNSRDVVTSAWFQHSKMSGDVHVNITCKGK